MTQFGVVHAPMADGIDGVNAVHSGLTDATEQTSALCQQAMEVMDGDTKLAMADLHTKLWQAHDEHNVQVANARQVLAGIHENYINMDNQGARTFS